MKDHDVFKTIANKDSVTVFTPPKNIFNPGFERLGNAGLLMRIHFC